MPPTISILLTANKKSLSLVKSFISLWLFLLMFFPATLQAQESSKNYQTQYATISYSSEKDLHTFTRNIGRGMSFLRESPEKNPLLAKSRVDKIVEIVSSILDMYPIAFRFNITLYKSRADITGAYKALGMLGDAPLAFYFHGTRNIAVSIEQITDRILAHEIAHAIICAYFVAPPPARMQEILTQHVDKNLGEW